MTQIDSIRKRLTLSQRRVFPVVIQELGMNITINEGVFPPHDLEQWRWLAENFPPVAGKRVLEIGCGAGLPGLYLAKCSALSLLACDIDPKAVRNTLENAERNDIRNVEVIQSDIFSNVPPNRKFDIIFWNYPWIFAPDDYTYRDDLERGAIDPGYRVLRRFLSEGTEFLTASGRIVLSFASGARDDLFLEAIAENDLACVLFASGTYPYVSHIYRMFCIQKNVKP